MVNALECTKCKSEITDYSKMVQILEDAGWTATYCEQCGQEVRKLMDARDRAIQ